MLQFVHVPVSVASILAISAAAAAGAGSADRAPSTARAGHTGGTRWEVSAPILSPGPKGAFDEVAVKDPSIVFHNGAWHLFYTARGRSEYTTGYVWAKTLAGLNAARRHELPMIRGTTRYGCAPQVFYFRPQRTWYLIFQTRDANYQPAYSTTRTLSDPTSWSQPKPLIRKDAKAKWIDFWIIADHPADPASSAANSTTGPATVYLFYTQAHRSVMVRSTTAADFPHGWGPAKEVLAGVHEAVHIYKAKGRDEYHMIYERNRSGIRSFGLATSGALTGPWKHITNAYATADQLTWPANVTPWTEMVSHGEILRTGYDEHMEYDPAHTRWLIQGILKKDAGKPYPSLPWKLGVMQRSTDSQAQSPKGIRPTDRKGKDQHGAPRLP